MAPWWTRVALSTGNRALAGEVVVTIEHLARINGELPSLTSSAVHARGLLEEDLSALQTAASGHVHAWARGRPPRMLDAWPPRPITPWPGRSSQRLEMSTNGPVPPGMSVASSGRSGVVISVPNVAPAADR